MTATLTPLLTGPLGPDAAPSAQRAVVDVDRPDPNEVDDHAVGRAFVIGAVVGTPGLWLLCTLVIWPFVATVGFAAAVSVWPALICGWYFAGVIPLALAVERRAAHLTHG